METETEESVIIWQLRHIYLTTLCYPWVYVLVRGTRRYQVLTAVDLLFRYDAGPAAAVW